MRSTLDRIYTSPNSQRNLEVKNKLRSKDTVYFVYNLFTYKKREQLDGKQSS